MKISDCQDPENMIWHSSCITQQVTVTFRTSADIAVIKQHEQLRHGFSFCGISYINCIAQLLDEFQILCFLAVAEISRKPDTAKACGEYVHEEGVYEIRAVHVHTKELTNEHIQDDLELLMPHNIPVYEHLMDPASE